MFKFVLLSSIFLLSSLTSLISAQDAGTPGEYSELNVTTSSSTTHNSTSDILTEGEEGNYFEATCQDNPRSSGIRIQDYQNALQSILVQSDAMFPVTWSSSLNPGKTWTYGGMNIVLSPAKSGSRDVFQPVLVARSAALIAQKCLTSSHGFRGGSILVGSKGEFWVRVLAKAGSSSTS